MVYGTRTEAALETLLPGKGGTGTVFCDEEAADAIPVVFRTSIERTISRAGNHGNECRLSPTGADGNMENDESKVEANSRNESYDISEN